MLDRPQPRDGWLARAAALKIEGRAFIDGAYVSALDGATFAKISPIDGKVFAQVSDCGADHIDRAVKSSRAALESYDRSSLATPFGGVRQSGFGRDRSPHAIDKYMDFKTVWTHYR
jgi:acyl-CoA reductase-like NAD-dependent aldehyde dehydrogenase